MLENWNLVAEELHRKYFDVASGQIDWRQQVDATRSSLPDPPGPPPAEKPPLLSPGTLFLAVQAAYNLTNTDTGLLGDVSDPYVVVRLGGQEFTTPVISNNLNPVWEADNRFTLTVTEEDKLLELEVKNSNHFRDDSLGHYLKVRTHRSLASAIHCQLRKNKPGFPIADPKRLAQPQRSLERWRQRGAGIRCAFQASSSIFIERAEAPPGALFTKFKEYVLCGGAESRDVAFYFCHWLTDLAGAEPYPQEMGCKSSMQDSMHDSMQEYGRAKHLQMVFVSHDFVVTWDQSKLSKHSESCPMWCLLTQEGCEKFVIKVPRKVLSSFINSFKIVGELSTKSESQVLEDYLVWRWTSHVPSLGQVPQGRGAVAALRLVVMAQGDSQQILRALQNSAVEDCSKRNMFRQLALTGCKDQLFALERPPEGAVAMGPAILIYYAPALMQKALADTAMLDEPPERLRSKLQAGRTDPIAALRILSELFRQARQFWPLLPSNSGSYVTVRIDVLKELEVKMITAHTPREVWALEKTSSRDAEVKKVTLGSEDLTSALVGSTLRVLNLSDNRPMVSMTPMEALGLSERRVYWKKDSRCWEETPLV
eukprot:g30113.t1